MAWIAQGVAGLSPTGPSPGLGPAGAIGTVADTGLLRATTSDILGLQSKAITDTANASASDIQGEGYAQEAGAYGTVGDIAAKNAVVAGVAGDIKALQEKRALTMTLGSQRADVAAAGFKNSGSSIDLFRASIQQGALARQLNRVQTTQAQGGYLEEGAAARAEAAGASTTSAAAHALAIQQRASGELATANAANETVALQTYIAGTTPTPESALVTSALKAPGGTPAAFDPTATATQTPGGFATVAPGVFTGFGSGKTFAPGASFAVRG